MRSGLDKDLIIKNDFSTNALNKIIAFIYDQSSNVLIQEISHLSEIPALLEANIDKVTWISIEGFHKTGLLRTMRDYFNIHPLFIEYIENAQRRPKFENHQNSVYMGFKTFSWEGLFEEFCESHISIILQKNLVITIQDSGFDAFQNIKLMLQEGKNRIRNHGADYLIYSLIDGVVENYFSGLEIFEEKIDSLEEDVLKKPNPGILHSIQKIKRELLFIRKSAWPLRALIKGLTDGEVDLIGDYTYLLFRDVDSHLMHILDMIETYRDIISGLLDVYLSNINNQMNEIMKVLTVISTLFIPLTFIAGIYGMNFSYMPELEYRWGYYGILALMGGIFIIMVMYFRHKRWF
jgi:magnesium transporter